MTAAGVGGPARWRARLPRFGAVVLGVLSVAGPAVEAQVEAPPTSMVRLTARDGERWVGRLVTPLDADTLLVVAEGAEVALVAAEMARIELGIARSPGRGFLRGLGLGAGIGGAAGALTVALVAGPGTAPETGMTRADAAVIGGVLFGALGAVIGGVIGLANPGRTWVDVEPGHPPPSEVPRTIEGPAPSR